MKGCLCFMLIIVAGCSGKNGNSALPDPIKLSTSQAFLNGLKDSLIYQYNSVGSGDEKQKVLDKYGQQLKAYLRHSPMDSILVTIDSVTTKGFTVRTKSHFTGIEFYSKITFADSMPPRLDSIFKFMKDLKPGSNVLANFGYTGDFEINTPDSPMLSTFRINAFPCPLQYKGK